MTDLREIEAALRACWSRASSDDPDEWTPEWSARGQCGVSAYVLRALLGGEILIAPVHGSHLPNEHHAWNRLPSGEEIDLTRDQFRAGETLGEPWVGEVHVEQDGVHRGELLLREVLGALGLDPDDRAFLAEALEGVADPFGHREHVRLAFVAAKVSDGSPAAVAALCERAIRRIAARAGKPDKFDAAITTAWATTIAFHVQRAPERSFAELLADEPVLLGRHPPEVPSR